MHDRLCFARAFPRTATDLRRAARGLARFERLARPVKGELENTGIAGTVVRYPFNYRMAQWLLARYGRAITVVSTLTATSDGSHTPAAACIQS